MSAKKPRRNCRACGKEVKRSVDVFCDNKCQRILQWSTTLAKILRTGKGENIGQARRLFKDQHFCLLCKKTAWCGSPIPLLIDHIDGHHWNWLVTNLRKICPNCDALLPTYKIRNRGNGRAYRRVHYVVGKSY